MRYMKNLKKSSARILATVILLGGGAGYIATAHPAYALVGDPKAVTTPAPHPEDNTFTRSLSDGTVTTVNIIDNDRNFKGDVQLTDTQGNPLEEVIITINGKQAGLGVINDNNQFVILWNNKGLTGEIDPVNYRITHNDATPISSITTGSITITIEIFPTDSSFTLS